MNRFSECIMSILLDFRQKQINRRYKKEGDSEKVIEMQADLNSKRNELDIPDKSQFIHENFVQ